MRISPPVYFAGARQVRPVATWRCHSVPVALDNDDDLMYREFLDAFKINADPDGDWQRISLVTEGANRFIVWNGRHSQGLVPQTGVQRALIRKIVEKLDGQADVKQEMLWALEA